MIWPKFLRLVLGSWKSIHSAKECMYGQDQCCLKYKLMKLCNTVDNFKITFIWGLKS